MFAIFVLFCFKGIIKAIRELKHLRTLDLSDMAQVDNSILEAAVSVLESDETRQLRIQCDDTNVHLNEFIERYKGTRLDHGYAYKNLVVHS